MNNINPNKRYTTKELEKLGFKETAGEKKYYRYFSNGKQDLVFKIIPTIGLHSANINEEILALKK